MRLFCMSRTPPAAVRRNVSSGLGGSELAGQVVPPGLPKTGITILCQYELQGDDNLREQGELENSLTAVSRTSPPLTSADSVRPRLAVDKDAVA